MQDNNQDQQASSGFLQRILSMPNDSTLKTIVMTLIVCLACAVVVAFSAVALKSKQLSNKLADKQKNILQVAGLDDDSQSIKQRFESIEAKIVDLASGEYVEDIDVASFDQQQASRDQEQSIALAKKQDIAGISRRANYAKVYLVKNDTDQVSKLILPIHGYGLWSTLYGFISLEPDLSTVYRLKFYDHKETPGLGGEVDNPKWRQIWTGKKVFDENNQYNLQVIKGRLAATTPDAQYKVDGLAGATLTSRGVDNLFKFWLGEQGFGPYLNRLRGEQG